MSRQRLTWAAAWLLACLSFAQAHQPYESSAIGRMEAEGFEVVMTLSMEIASMLAGGPVTDEASFEKQRASLLLGGKHFYQVSAGHQMLTVSRVSAQLRQGEVVLSLMYPPVQAAGLRVRAAYLDKLPLGYGGNFSLFDERRQLLDGPPLLKKGPGRDAFTVTQPAERKAPGPSKQAPEPTEPQKAPGTNWLWRVIGGALVVGLALELRRRLGLRVQFTLGLLLLTASPLCAQRQMERLGRGLTTLKSSSTQVYVGWRLLGNDPEDVAFNLYRAANGGTPVKVNATPITATTDYVDTPSNLSTTAYTYLLKPVLSGIEVIDTWANLANNSVTLPANAPARQYIPVPLTPTPDDAAAGVSYRVKFCWVGDFDGDGEYDFVVERSNPNIEARQWVQAYKRDGTLLWQMNMGPNSVDHYNITPGSSTIGIGHGDNLTVYDLDGDGKAEVIIRTANGVVFANGSVLNAPDDEAQYISVIDGLTGTEKGRALIPVPAEWVARTHMNAHMGIVYADGMKPSIFYQGSNRNPDQSFNKVATVWDFRDGALTQRWTWPFSGHTAEGHQVRFADVNNDGTDEYVDVGHVLRADGSGQINGSVLADVVHGDRIHLSDVDPDRPGLETFLIQQNNVSGLATVLCASDKSAVIRKQYAAGVVDVGRGTLGAFVPNLPGLQYFSTVGGTYDRKGSEIYSDSPFPPETIWWDGNLAREFVATIGSAANSPGIDRFNTATPGSTSRVLTIYSDPAAPGYPFNNYIADGGRPQFWGDILGDWREELLCVAKDNSELRIYTTKTPDEAKSFGGMPFRIYTLMHNPQYRVQATTKGYVQSSYVDYYLGYGMPPPPPPPMVDAKLAWRGGSGLTTWDAGTTMNWQQSNAGNSAYADGDSVRFDASGDATAEVQLNDVLHPGAVTVFSPTDYTFAGTGSLGGAMKLMKSGAGKLMLSGSHAFMGKTTVWDGALVVNGALTGSAVTVWGGTWGGALAKGRTGGRLAGTGSLAQQVTLKYRGAITPGAGMDSAGTLTCAGGLVAEEGSTFALDLSSDPAGLNNDRIAVNGGVSLSGVVRVYLNPINGSLGAGTYTLLTCGTLNGSLANLSLIVPEGTPGMLAVSGNAITFTVPVTRAAAAVTWRGSGNAWDLAASANWTKDSGGAADVFVAGDTVMFDAAGAAAPSVNLTTGLPTNGITVNAATDYTFNGAGYLAGAGGLVKNGSGVLTITTANTYTGPTVVNGGVLAVSALGDAASPSAVGSASAGAANLVVDGGTLRLASSQTSTDRSLTLGAGGGAIELTQSSSSLQIGGSLTGSGGLIKKGAGTLLLASASNYAGGTLIEGGKIFLAGATANSSGLGSGTVTISNGTLSMANVQASETAAWNVVVPAGGLARIDADGRCSLTGTLTGSGTLTFYTPYVRTDLKGNWSAFTGRVQVITSDGGDFRVANTFGYANAAINLGPNVYAYYSLTPGTNGVTVSIGELSGDATSFLSGGPVGGRTVTWQIGARNTDSTYAGTIRNSTGPTAISKVGTGTLTLTGPCTYTGATTVLAGRLCIAGTASGGSGVTVAAGATLELHETGSLSVGGAITNHGTLRVFGNAALSATGTIINNGVLDLIHASSIPANVQNHGVILLASDVRAQSASMTAGGFVVSMQCHPGHLYKLQANASLTGGTWADVAGSTFTPVTSTSHAFVDPTPGSGPRFYRVLVEPMH